MESEIHPLATHYLPAFIVAPGQTDSLLIGIGIFLIVVIFLLGIAFLWLHSLPERMAHKGQKLQFEVVAVLCLLALFTHNNLLWGAALLLALLDIPDISTPLGRIGDAIERLTGSVRRPAAAAVGAASSSASASAVSAPSQEVDAALPEKDDISATAQGSGNQHEGGR